MEPKQSKRKGKALGRDPFADMEWDDGDEAAEEPSIKPLFVDEPIITTNEKPAISVDDNAPDDLDDLAGMLMGSDTAVDLNPSPPAADFDNVPDDLDDLAGMLMDSDTAVDAPIEEEPISDTEPDEIPTDKTVNIDALLHRINSEIESINKSIQRKDTEESKSGYLDDLVADIDEQIGTLYNTRNTEHTKLPDEQSNPADETDQYIIFELMDNTYAMPISNVTEIGRPLPITTVPNVPHWLLGIANLRGDIISIVDLRGFLGLSPADSTQEGRLLITRSTNEETAVGLIVDSVSGIRFLQNREINTSTAVTKSKVAPYLRGIYSDKEQLLIVLNIDKLLLSSEMQQFK